MVVSFLLLFVGLGRIFESRPVVLCLLGLARRRCVHRWKSISTARCAPCERFFLVCVLEDPVTLFLLVVELGKLSPHHLSSGPPSHHQTSKNTTNP